jgi:electron transfer flavoprotein beta subunit
MGADELCQTDNSDIIDGWTKSLLPADAVKELKADLVFCGEKSMDSGSGQTGLFMAYHLGVPFISRVTDITLQESGLPIRAERNCGRGKREIVECGLAAVFSAVSGPKIPRYPSLENKRRLSRKPIQNCPSGSRQVPPRSYQPGFFQRGPGRNRLSRRTAVFRHLKG